MPGFLEDSQRSLERGCPCAKSALMLWDDLLRVMRKDLGKDDSQLERGELVSEILKAGEKHKAKQGSD